jgi:SWI/SNF-related matrix-associated actin-dependent regulator 1 of chromatin subfamily A
MIKLKYQNNRYEAVCSLKEAQIVRTAKFEYDFDARVFFTYLPERAVKLLSYAIDDYTAQMIETEIAQMRRNYKKSYALTGTIDVPLPEGKALKPFQLGGIEGMLERGNTLLADDQGTGKTIQVIGAINVCKPNSILIICPATIKYQWVSFINDWCVHPYSIQVLKGQKKQKITTPVVITNYAILSYQKEIYKRQWDLIVTDEGDYLVNEEAQRTKNFLKLTADWYIDLTGTPGDTPIDLYPMLKTLAPNIWGDWESYSKKYCDRKPYIEGVTKKYKRGWDVGGASNLDEWNKRMRATVMIRREKKDVLPWLPKVQKEIVPLEPEQDKGEKIAHFLNLEQDLICKHILKRQITSTNDYEIAVDMLIEDNMINADATCFATYRKELGLFKIGLIKAYIDLNLKHYKKIVVVVYHRDVIQELYETYKDISVMVKGGGTPKQRQKQINRFQTDDNVNIFFGQINCIARGIDGLQNVCHRMIIVEIDWSLRNMIQVPDRLYRMGQNEPAIISYLALNRTLEVRIAKRYLEKEGIFKEMYK